MVPILPVIVSGLHFRQGTCENLVWEEDYVILCLLIITLVLYNILIHLFTSLNFIIQQSIYGVYLRLRICNGALSTVQTYLWSSYTALDYSCKTLHGKGDIHQHVLHSKNWLVTLHEQLVKLCILVNQNLTIQATESNKRYSRSTAFNVLKGKTECFVVLFGFLRNSPLSNNWYTPHNFPSL